MAVSPLRALLTAQAQSTWNRLLREGGTGSVVVSALVALLVAAAVTPPMVACLVIGRSYGRGLATGEGLGSGLGGIQALILAGGMLSGLLEHRLTFSVEAARLYPIPRLSLLGAELVAGLLNLLALLAGLCGLALTLGLSLGAPHATPVLLLIGLQALLWVALLQHAVGIAKRWVTGTRLALGAAAGALALALVAALLVPPTPGPVLPQAVRATVRGLGAALQFLPFTAAYRGVGELLQGHAVTGWLRQLPLLATSARCVALVAVGHFAIAERTGGAQRRKPERLWSHRSPVATLARVYRGLVLGSRDGRIALFLPLILSAGLALSLLAAKDAARLAVRPLPWPLSTVEVWGAVPLMGILLALLPTMDEQWLNQFGPDGPAVRTLLLLPIRPEQILLSRTLGLLPVHTLKVLLGIGPLLFQYRPPLAELAWGACASGTVFLVLAACGHLVSARLPRRVRDEAFLGSNTTPLTSFLVPPVVKLPTLALLILVYKASAPLGAWGPALGMALLLVAATVGYWRVLPFLGARLLALRDHLVEELA